MAKFFYTPKPRQFDYRPRYYDPEQEARERRRAELLGEKVSASDEEYVPGQLLRNRRLQRMIDDDRKRSMARRKTRSSMVLIVMIVLLIAAVKWVDG